MRDRLFISLGIFSSSKISSRGHLSDNHWKYIIWPVATSVIALLRPKRNLFGEIKIRSYNKIQLMSYLNVSVWITTNFMILCGILISVDTYAKMVIRACVMKNMDSQCGEFKYEDQTMSGCILTCDFDGCNRVSRLYQYQNSFLLFSLLFFIQNTVV